ncbi:hypothetical protein PIB30_088277 [Stylosanthes scabra]|uniref:Uncharacterized protein n=1 Tax=Stylosanthes scabra TaxID=79078 RepID=A0ABU6VUU5_9FABA|nr:hypothetical protein [Stylosanthes scabra]
MAGSWPRNVEFPFYPSLNCILMLSRGRAMRGARGRGRLLLRHQAYVGAAARSGPCSCVVAVDFLFHLKGAAAAAVGRGRAATISKRWNLGHSPANMWESIDEGILFSMNFIVKNCLIKKLEGQIQSLCVRTKGASAYALPCLGHYVLAGTGPYAYAPKGPMRTHQWPNLCL